MMKPEEMTEILNQAIDYFKQEKGFRLLLEELVQKYRSIGRVGGKVTLSKLTTQEKEVLSSFFRKDFANNEVVTVTFPQFEKALAKTKFAGVDVRDLLACYIGEPIISKVEEKERYDQTKMAFFDELKQNYIHASSLVQGFLQFIQDKGQGTRGFHLAYEKDRERFKETLINVLNAIETLLTLDDGNGQVNNYFRLPVFASQITKDPHGFDLDKDAGRFLLIALQWLQQLKDPDHVISSSLTAEQTNELTQSFGIIRDDILNFVTSIGILGLHQNQEVDPFWLEAYKAKRVLNTPLKDLKKNQFYVPFVTLFLQKPNIVFVVENSGVFSEIADHFGYQNTLDIIPPIICTHGQFKLATLILLDFLVQNGSTIYYSGDFDPEGLQMAERLKLRYPKQVQLWHYTVDDYLISISEVKLSAVRLKKLEQLQIKELEQLKGKIADERMAGYQEKLIPLLIEDIKKFNYLK